MKKILFILFILSNLPVTGLAQEKSADSSKTLNPVLQDTSETVAADSTKKIEVKESITPIRFGSLIEDSSSGNVLNKQDLNKTDYRYTGNYFSNIPFGFLRDLGSFGQPNEVLIYGRGFNNSSYLSDGIGITNRLTNSFDLNLFQSESIEAIEILPLTEGFLYGNMNNSVAVNFIPSDYHVKKPYTRIRFYQAANQEGMIDGIFNTTINKKLGIHFELTNHSTDASYKNSSYGSWLTTTRFRYLLNDKINLFANYRYSNSNVQLNGGVDLLDIQNNYGANQTDIVLYDKFLAPVKFDNNYQKTWNHDIHFGAVAELFPGHKAKITGYFQSSLNEFRQNDSTNRSNLQTGLTSRIDNNKYESTGLQLDQNYNADIVKVRAIAAYEQNRYSTPLLLNKYELNTFSFSAKASFNLLDSRLIPSVFGKYLSYNKTGFSGFGANVIIKINDEINLFGGYSEYQKPPSNLGITGLFDSSIKPKNKNFEFSAMYDKGDMKFQAGFFTQTFSNSETAILIKDYLQVNPAGYNEYAHYLAVKDKHLKGANLNFNIILWKILISTNSSYYFSEEDGKEFGIPQFTSAGGIYYIDTLFNKNLKLKMGLNYWSVGSRNNVSYDFEKNISTPYNWILSTTARTIPYIPAEKYNANFQLDFFLTGQIQNNAIIYFTFENLLDTNYYIIPYFPMRSRAMRFGVAWEFLD